MPQIISSAIVNAPPPNVLIKMMHVFNIAKQSVNKGTREKMVRVFKGRYKQSDKVMGRRNYLVVQGDSTDRLQCTLRIELPEALGSVETFQMYIPVLSGYGRPHTDLPRVQSYPVAAYHAGNVAPPLEYSPSLPVQHNLGNIMQPNPLQGWPANAPPMLQHNVHNPYVASGNPEQTGVMGVPQGPGGAYSPEWGSINRNQGDPQEHKKSQSSGGYFGPVI